ncbi:hypothetical protein P3T76_008954 [Phytophthora citrophthora]|uniref:Uncharacterized protein n=1 Tax=Phytophthora citrophthora TaxID=4793 RepID=A0AAD9GHY4_9STRA|nr:hypothetical protein P3T76_008954 [Phytophthora citrophthora]
MQFSLNKLCLREDWTLPSFGTMFPDAASRLTPDSSSIDASMTLGGLPPLHPDDKDNVKIEYVSSTEAAGSNEIVTAFESLDAEVAEDTKFDIPVPPEIQCRYRQGKCSKSRTLKKNGMMHSYCEYHRQLSVRNQRVFDQKKRKQHQSQLEGRENQPKRSRPTAENDSNNHHLQLEPPRVKRRRRTM